MTVLAQPVPLSRVEHVVSYRAPCPCGRDTAWTAEFRAVQSEIQATPQNVTIAYPCCDCEERP